MSDLTTRIQRFIDVMNKQQSQDDEQISDTTELEVNFVLAEYSDGLDQPIQLTLEDLRALLVAATSTSSEEFLIRLDAVVGAYNDRIRRQVDNQNRLLRKFKSVYDILRGGGTDGTKIIEIRKVV